MLESLLYNWSTCRCDISKEQLGQPTSAAQPTAVKADLPTVTTAEPSGWTHTHTTPSDSLPTMAKEIAIRDLSPDSQLNSGNPLCLSNSYRGIPASFNIYLGRQAWSVRCQHQQVPWLTPGTASGSIHS